MIIIKELSPITLDVVCPHCSFSEGLAFAVCKGIEGENELIEFISGSCLLGFSEMVIGNLRHEHVSLIPPSVTRKDDKCNKDDCIHLIYYTPQFRTRRIITLLREEIR